MSQPWGLRTPFSGTCLPGQLEATIPVGMRAFLGLGGNLGDPPAQFAAALELLTNAGVTTLRGSSLYSSPPLGPPQPDYVNAVVEIETKLDTPNLLQTILAVEGLLGRKRDRRWGPRSLDIDILLYEALVFSQPGLTIPHPGLAERAFVLVPLAELEPGARHPVLNLTMAELLVRLPSSDVAAVRRLDRGWR
jgi:2-amino-4-hydroxy-6-hydroxymethyldihydropteridine diphosphokinase